MPRMPDIVPISDLRQGAAALLQKLRNSREVLSLMVRGEQEIAAGVGYDLDQVLAEVDGILEGI